MKKIICILVVAFFCTASLVNAQSKSEVAVAAAVENLRLAMISGDSVSLRSVVSDKLSYGHSGGHIDDQKEFIEKLTSGKSDFVTIELKEQTISVSGDVAIVRHILNATTNDGGKAGEVHLRVMLVFQKEGKHWKMLGRQAVKI